MKQQKNHQDTILNNHIAILTKMNKKNKRLWNYENNWNLTVNIEENKTENFPNKKFIGIYEITVNTAVWLLYQ